MTILSVIVVQIDGWTSGTPGSFDRGAPDNLHQDGHSGQSANTFRIQAAPSTSYIIIVHVGDSAFAVTAASVSVSTASMAPVTTTEATLLAGTQVSGFSSSNFTLAANNFRKLTFNITAGGSDTYININFAGTRWVVNAIEIEDPPAFAVVEDAGARESAQIAAVHSLPTLASTSFFDSPVFQGKALALAHQSVLTEVTPTARTLSSIRFLAKPVQEASDDFLDDDTAEGLLSLWANET